MQFKNLFLHTCSAVVLTLALPAVAADISAGQRLAASCASCHGATGVSASGALVSLAGQPKDALVASMRAFKAGTKPATIMHQLSKGYTDEQIELIAGYYAAQKNTGAK